MREPNARIKTTEDGYMGIALIQLVPLVLGTMIMPTWVLLVLFLLSRSQGRGDAIAFVSGVTAVKLLQGLIFGLFIGLSQLDEKKSELEIVISTLLVVVGILLWVTALTLLIRKVDPDTSVPSWRRMVNAITPLKAFGLGALLVVTSTRAWIFTLAALAVIGNAELHLGLEILTFLLYVVAAELLLIAPILMSTRSSAQLEAMANWLEKHDRPIMIAVSFLVGAFFLWQGAAGLL